MQDRHIVAVRAACYCQLTETVQDRDRVTVDD